MGQRYILISPVKDEEKCVETTLRTVINWGRFAEIFAYDDDEQRFTLENPS